MRTVIRLGFAFLAVVPVVSRAQSVTVGSPISAGQVAVNYVAPTGYEQSWGQTFRTPNSTAIALDSWSFWLNALANPIVTLQLQIAEWNGTGLAASPFFTSALYSPAVSTQSFLATFAIGQILDPTKVYIAFLNPVGLSGDPSATTGYDLLGVSCAGCGGGTGYAGGDLVLLQSTLSNGVYRDLANAPDAATFTSYDSQFQARFTSTPEPASWALVATGLLGLAGVVHKRRQA